MKRKVVLMAFVLTLLSLGIVGRFVNADIVGASMTQEVAPDFTLTDIDGNVFSLSDYRERVVLLHFFTPWCPACIDEIPHLKTLYEKFGEKVVIISISPEDETVLREFREEHGIGWTIARDIANVFDAYNVRFVPTLVLIDPEGYICYRHVGLTEELVLSQEIKEILLVHAPGDVNGDGIVDIHDIVIVTLAFGTKSGDPKWNPIADIYPDGLIDIFDLVTIAIHFGETW